MKFWHFTNSKAAFRHDWDVGILPHPTGYPIPFDLVLHGFGAGMPVDKEAVANVTVRSTMPLEPVVCTGNGLLVKQAIGDCLAKAFPDHLQILPIVTDGPWLDGYTCVNLTKRYDCIDRTRSEIVWRRDDPEKINALIQLWLNDKIPNEPGRIFRVEGNRSLVVVDEEAKRKLIGCGIDDSHFSDLVVRSFNARGLEASPDESK